MKHFTDDFDQHKRRILQRIEERLEVVNKNYEKMLNDLSRKQFDLINLND